LNLKIADGHFSSSVNTYKALRLALAFPTILSHPVCLVSVMYIEAPMIW
jgi:hypothetical protein